MSKTRLLCGYLAATILVLSAAMHTLMGWPGIRAELSLAQLPPELMFGVQMVWHFAGMAMLVFGAMLLALFRRAQRGLAAPAGIALAVGIGYLGFGVAEFIASAYAPFTFVFIVPGALLLAAAWPARVLRAPG